MGFTQPGAYFFYPHFFPIDLFSLLCLFPHNDIINLLGLWHNYTGKVRNIASLLKRLTSLFGFMLILRFHILQRHNYCEHKCFHHIVIEVQPLGGKVFQAASKILVLAAIDFERVQHNFQVEHGPLWVEVVDLNIGQEQRAVGLRQLVGENFSDSHSWMGRSLPERRAARVLADLQ